MKKTRTFKSGNSVAVRLPKALGVEPGVEMIVRKGRGRYIIEPIEDETPGRKIDLSGIYGSVPGLQPIDREREEYEDLPREWHLLGLQPRG